MYLSYIENHCLKNIEMSYRDIGWFPGLQIIDWMHSAEPSELPCGQEVLAELSEYMHRTDLTPEEKDALREVFYCDDKLLLKTQRTLTELLNEIDINQRIRNILDEENCWLTFDELYEKTNPDCDWFEFANELEQLVKRQRIQYVLPIGADVGCYGKKGLKNTLI